MIPASLLSPIPPICDALMYDAYAQAVSTPAKTKFGV